MFGTQSRFPGTLTWVGKLDANTPLHGSITASHRAFLCSKLGAKVFLIKTLFTKKDFSTPSSYLFLDKLVAVAFKSVEADA